MTKEWDSPWIWRLALLGLLVMGIVGSNLFNSMARDELDDSLGARLETQDLAINTELTETKVVLITQLRELGFDLERQLSRLEDMIRAGDADLTATITSAISDEAARQPHIVERLEKELQSQFQRNNDDLASLRSSLNVLKSESQILEEDFRSLNTVFARRAR